MLPLGIATYASAVGTGTGEVTKRDKGTQVVEPDSHDEMSPLTPWCRMRSPL